MQATLDMVILTRLNLPPVRGVGVALEAGG